jgi:uncharacterized protein YggU (UPF0235/DUF167 family)
MLFVQDLPIKISSDGLGLCVKVTQKASLNRIGQVLDGYLKIYVKALPEDGQANKAVIELLAHELKISKSSISIVSGFTVNKKLINFSGNNDEIMKRLQIVISK